MIQPDHSKNRARHLAESFLLLLFVAAFSQATSGLSALVYKFSSHYSEVKTELVFPIASPTTQIRFPYSETKIPAEFYFKSITCNDNPELTEADKKVFTSEALREKLFIKCQFFALNGDVTRYQDTYGYGGLREKIYIDEYFLSQLNGGDATTNTFREFKYNQATTFPFTNIPHIVAQNLVAAILSFFVALALIAFTDYQIRTEKQKILTGFKSAITILLIGSPLFMLHIELFLRAALDGTSLPFMSAFFREGRSFFDTILLGPLTEEMIFRVWMLYLLSKRFSPAWCIVISAALFAWVHDSNLFGSIMHFTSGVLWAIIWFRTKSLVLCVVPHSIHNAAVTILQS
jgi:membrane protease YdiL (CAAX protease family)